MATPFTSGATWSWPNDEGLRDRSSEHHVPGKWESDTTEASTSRPEPTRTSVPTGESSANNAGSQSQGQRQRRRHYRPRTCRICLEVVQPTSEPMADGVSGMLGPRPRVVYEDESGRLICPCKCKGSQKYVHEGCLDAWRISDSNLNSRKYLQCPTCGFRYRTERVMWSRWIGSTAAQVGLTFLILFLTVFILGFVADPIINLYFDPYDTLLGSTEDYYYINDEPTTWAEHLVKGLASLGLLGFVKAILAMSPWHLWNMRSSGILGGRRGNTGRDRIESISWTLVLIGVVTFLLAVWKGVRIWTRRVLEYARDKVADVQGDDDGDDDEE